VPENCLAKHLGPESEEESRDYFKRLLQFVALSEYIEKVRENEREIARIEREIARIKARIKRKDEAASESP